MAGYRQNRIDEEVRRELGAVIRTLKDPRIADIVSVVQVEVTRDLRYATAYISVMGGDKAEADTLTALKAAAGFVRREIGNRLKLRAVPEFIFKADHSIQYGAHINQVLKDVLGNDKTENDEA